MMRAALVPALYLATAASGSRLEIALQNYPRVHHVRAVWACPATELQARAMASSGATVESCNVMAQCPAPGGRYTY